jgi:tetratricopeptide (TPR) repeat protein
MWGMIGFGLLILFIFVGYQAALKFPTPTVPLASSTDGDVKIASSAAQEPANSLTESVNPRSSDATHSLFREAADHHQDEAALKIGQQIFDSGSASPDDLQIMAQTYMSLKDCPNALIWFERASDAVRHAGKELDESLRRIESRCGSGALDKPISPEHRERIMRLLASFKKRAEEDRKNLPQLEADAALSKSGDLDVKLGELYFGFGEYDLAITAIKRGLEKGNVTHLDDAYVYLGRSDVAVRNFTDARSAFAQLKKVANISPKVAHLWELYGDTLPATP